MPAAPKQLMATALLLALLALCPETAWAAAGEGFWSPYLVGFGIGLISILAFLLSGSGLGASSAYMRTGGMLEKSLRGKDVVNTEFYQDNPPQVTWQWMLIAGVVLGALFAALLSGTFSWEWTPAMWSVKFSHNFFIRWLVALNGGFLISFGARLAGGCTSGHGITGTLQLVVSSWVALCCFFAGGVAVAYMIY